MINHLLAEHNDTRWCVCVCVCVCVVCVCARVCVASFQLGLVIAYKRARSSMIEDGNRCLHTTGNFEQGR